MYMASVDMATTVVTQSETMSYNMSESDYSLAYSVKESNRQSFATTNIYNQYRSILSNKFQYVGSRAAVQYDINAIYKTGKSITDKVNTLLYKSNNVGINWSPNTIFNYLSIKFSVPFNVIKALYHDGMMIVKLINLYIRKLRLNLLILMVYLIRFLIRLKLMLLINKVKKLKIVNHVESKDCFMKASKQEMKLILLWMICVVVLIFLQL